MALSLARLLGSEYLTSATWNATMALIETEFTLPVTLVWPVQAEGALDMLGNEIINVTKFWNIYNADEYATFQLALDAVATDGSGCIVIPPNVTISTNGALADVDDLMILGYGSSSVLQHDGGAGTDIISTVGDSRITFSNLTIDGNSETGKDGIFLNNATDVTLDNVRIVNFGGASDWGLICQTGTSTNVNVTNCIELDSVRLIDCSDVRISNSTLTGKLEVSHPGAGDKGLRLSFDDLYFNGVDSEITNVAGAADANLNIVSYTNCVARSSNFAFDKVTNLVIDGMHMYSDGDGGKGIYALDCETSSLRNVKVMDYSGNNGIHLEGGGTHEWNNVSVHNSGNAGTTEASIHIEGPTTFIGTDVKTFDSLYSGIILDGAFTVVVLSDAFVDQGASGTADGFLIDITGVSACTVFVKDGVFIGGTGQGIELAGTPTLTKRISISGGKCTGAAIHDGPHSAAGLYIDEFETEWAFGDRRSQTVYGTPITWDSASLAPYVSETKAVTVPGARSGAQDHVYTFRHTDVSNARYFNFTAKATSDDTVTVTAINMHDVSTFSLTGDLYVVGHPIQGN